MFLHLRSEKRSPEARKDLFNWQMSLLNNVTWLLGAGGAYHAGVEVYGLEYAFGGTCKTNVRCCRECLLLVTAKLIAPSARDARHGVWNWRQREHCHGYEDTSCMPVKHQHPAVTRITTCTPKSCQKHSFSESFCLGVTTMSAEDNSSTSCARVIFRCPASACKPCLKGS